MRLLMLWYYIITSLFLIFFPIAVFINPQLACMETGMGFLFFGLPFHLHQIYYAYKDYSQHKLEKKVREQQYLQKKLKESNKEG